MMRIPFRRSGPDGAVAVGSRRLPRRALRSTLDALEARQLLSAVPAAAVDVARPAAIAPEGPRIASVQFLPLTGRVQFTITEGASAVDPARLLDPANYALAPVRTGTKAPAGDPSRPGVGVVLVPNYVVTGVSLTPNPRPGLPQLVTVVINNNQPLRPGTYRFTIRSAGLVDEAGVPLDGAYRGVFPSGDGRPGGDFVADLVELKHSVLAPIPVSAKPPGPGVTPSPAFVPTTREVFVRVAGNNNRTSRTLGGGNAFAVALPGQGYPVTSLATSKGSSRGGKPRG